MLLLMTVACLNCYGQEVKNTVKSIVGQWVTHDNRAVIKIYEDGDKYYGKIDSLLIDSIDKQLLGTMVLSDFKLKEDEYIEGRMYDPESDGAFRSKLWLIDDNTLKVRDYCGLMYHTFTWKRIK